VLILFFSFFLLSLSVVFSNVAHFTIGAYVFEFLASLEFEWQVLTGERPFKAPMLVRALPLPYTIHTTNLRRKSPPRPLSQLQLTCSLAALFLLQMGTPRGSCRNVSLSTATRDRDCRSSLFIIVLFMFIIISDASDTNGRPRRAAPLVRHTPTIDRFGMAPLTATISYQHGDIPYRANE
jgi:hypothetical protein